MSIIEHVFKSEVLPGLKERRRGSHAEALAIVAKTQEPGVTVSLVARRDGLAPNQLFTLRELAEEGAMAAAGNEEEIVPASN